MAFFYDVYNNSNFSITLAGVVLEPFKTKTLFLISRERGELQRSGCLLTVNTITETAYDTRGVLQRQEVAAEVSEAGSTTAFSYYHATLDSVWTVAHNLGFIPNISVFDIGGNEIDCSITHLSVNVVRVNFTLPMQGTLRAN